jgi:hypothetical protein
MDDEDKLWLAGNSHNSITLSILKSFLKLFKAKLIIGFNANEEISLNGLLINTGQRFNFFLVVDFIRKPRRS